MKRDSVKDPLHALVTRHWLDWTGLHADFGLQTLAREYGGATLLDHRAALGSERLACSISSLNGLPVLVWHDGEFVLRVAHDRLDRPLPTPPDASRFTRLDVVQGTRLVHGGEWVDAAHGLALIVTPGGSVIEVAGFAPTTPNYYLTHRRPIRKLPIPQSLGRLRTDND